MATDRSPRSPGGGNEPSRAEIQQRVSSLYDRAETDTGTYNATRAMSNLSRRKVGSVANSGRGSADPSLEAVAKQWFDVARDKIGPTTPAVLPADRRPPRPARPGPSADSATIRELEAAARRISELTAPAAAAPPAAIEARRSEPRALEAAAPAALTAPLPALPAPAALPAAPASAAAPAAAPADRQASLRSTKEQIGRKLATAREVLARAVAQPTPSQQPALTAFIPAQSTSSPSMQSLPTATAPTGHPSAVGLPQQPAGPQPVQQPWDTAEQQAFRAEISAAWAGKSAVAPAMAPAVAPAVALSAGPESLLDTGGFSFAAPAPAFSASDIALVEPTSDHGVAELGAGAPSFGHPIPGLGAAAPESGYATSPTDAVAPGYLMDELGTFTPPAGYAYPELPVTASEFGYAAVGSAPAPAYPTSGLGLPAPTPDALTAHHGYQTSPGPTAPVAPLPEPVRPTAPADVTVSATGTAYLGKADKALAFARAQTGRPCVWGATGPESYDCSSLTQAAWKAAGVSLPRAAIDQAKAFTRISLADLRAGDLVFFFDDLSHVGLCTGNGMMIHAPGPGAAIREEAILPYGEGALRGAVRPA
ncbi:cell wall-associated NlpC family hydrolase [Streptomyces achromogenes]|uniref:Cell wall-associated NlpC family hydrolase n=1 Tax=Streptomyces achromogenes TaxID=67255 RepID=A0ABU0QC12_STRAH|nr:C40 family peptidase [Streptomyces achromogenes]MDQ0688206.1 cell wall-associated NlpC family hydrolase [Streptomyces achromogenes]